MTLFQVASPAHIPYNDTRFQELIHGYDVWVHVEVRDDPDGVMNKACKSMSKHAINSSNLAALAILVCEMLDDLKPPGGGSSSSRSAMQKPDQVAAFSQKIAIVGKARAAAGSLQLLRMFIHRILIDHGTEPAVLDDIFTYKNRDTSDKNRDTATELMNTLFLFLISDGLASVIKDIPELYDTTVFALQLLIVMMSTQLYQPMISTFQQSQQQSTPQSHYFLDRIMQHGMQVRAQERYQEHKEKTLSNSDSNLEKGIGSEFRANLSTTWTPGSILTVCLTWQIQRPKSPARSIAHHHAVLAESVVAAKGEKVGADGMYESNFVVTAAAQKASKTTDENLGDSSSSIRTSSSSHAHQSSFLLDTTRGVLVKASSIIMLPFRLMSLALGLWGHREKGYDKSRRTHISSSFQSSRTKDVIWITESPVADLAASLFLLLTNNCRAAKPANANETDSPKEGNPFRAELSSLSDNRWEQGHDGSALPDLPDPLGHPAELNESISLLDAFNKAEPHEELLGAMVMTSSKRAITTNFETLFLSFGSILHTELGALLLYTLLQSSKAFSETIAVRSDLDTLVLPLLRTLYFSSQSRHVSAQDFHSKSHMSADPKPKRQESEKSLLATNATGTAHTFSIRNCPFRSQSQLYVIVILLLLFSQDPSFGSDAFRRSIISSVPWYKERYLKDVSLGSVMLLTLLRCLTFNLNRLHDMFLLSNCCAVLMNLSHSVVDLHEYAAMRLTSVTISCLTKYLSLTSDEGETDGSSLYEMYAEVSHTLLRLIKHTLEPKNIDRNLHLVYALVYHQADFKKIFGMKQIPFKKSEISRIHAVIKIAAKIIESQFNARTATKALQVLTDNMGQIKDVVAEKKKKGSEKEDFTFTYEEETDPEIFFVPYVWEVIVCTVTASSIEWDKNKIQVFPLLEADEPPPSDLQLDADAMGEGGGAGPHAAPNFAQDVLDVV